MATDVVSRIAAEGVVPVVVLNSARNAASLAKALARGGLSVAEITFRTSAAAASIEAIRREAPETPVGAGTVANADQVREAASAGASFVVTPGFNRRVVEACVSSGMPVFPGVNAPGFVEMALEYGLETLKFFPAEQSGGVAFLTALAGPYPNVRFIPTGGIGPDTLASYLALPSVVACGGSWMVDRKPIEAEGFEAIANLTAAAVQAARRARPAKSTGV
ncbi:MAG: bifunctional 4-hydroxy-2-oxoglutarate aldolase/2-dehydro-3-deoxy-phosphogluconate aldolase [Roseiarcus sp.]|jgi:2-dehydro-3-deoxyphosphogluconate aldolase/(4S)-4-hydroxy-2-oxoglutarate aldolase